MWFLALLAVVAPARVCFTLAASQQVRGWHGAWWFGSQRALRPDEVTFEMAAAGGWTRLGAIALQSERADGAAEGACVDVPAGPQKVLLRCAHRSWRHVDNAPTVNDRVWILDASEVRVTEARSSATALELELVPGTFRTVEVGCAVAREGRRFQEMVLRVGARAALLP